VGSCEHGNVAWSSVKYSMELDGVEGFQVRAVPIQGARSRD